MTDSPYPPWMAVLVTKCAEVRAEHFSRVLVPPDGSGRHSAVLTLFAGNTLAEADVLLLQRSLSMRSHAGQVAFPGGATDPEDGSAAATALRESAEEVGLRPDTVNVLAALPELFVPPSRFRVTPVLGFWAHPHPVGAVDAGEVAAVHRVSITRLLDPANRFTVRTPTGYTGPAFEVDGLFVWGFTAALLAGLLRLGGLDVPWDAATERELPA